MNSSDINRIVSGVVRGIISEGRKVNNVKGYFGNDGYEAGNERARKDDSRPSRLGGKYGMLKQQVDSITGDNEYGPSYDFWYEYATAPDDRTQYSDARELNNLRNVRKRVQGDGGTSFDADRRKRAGMVLELNRMGLKSSVTSRLSVNAMDRFLRIIREETDGKR